MTALDAITAAMKKLGVLAGTQQPSPDEAEDGLNELNNLINEWATMRLTISQATRVLEGLTNGQAAYTIGEGGNFNRQRPVWIERVSVIPDDTVSNPTEISIGVCLSLIQWQRIVQKATTSQFPLWIFYRQNWSAGLGTIDVYPVPTSSNAALVLYVPVALSEFADLTTNYTFAPAFRKAIEWNLAVALGPTFGRVPSQFVQREAAKALGSVKRSNFQISEADFDQSLAWNSARDNFNIKVGP
jgi:hypothetical protein